MSHVETFLSFPPARLEELPPDAVCLPGVSEGCEDKHFRPLPLHDRFAPMYALDWLAAHSPDFPAIRRQAPDASPPYRDITYREWAARTRRAGRYVLRALGLSEREAHASSTAGPEGEASPLPIALCAHVDGLDYTTVAFGIQRVGLVDVNLATNSAADALAHMIRQAGAHHILVGPRGSMVSLDTKLDQVQSQLSDEGWEIHLIPWPEHETLLSGPDLDVTPAEQLAPYRPDRPVAILHSSGTTGKFPKLRVHRQKLLRAHQVWGWQSPGNVMRDVLFVGNMPAFHMFFRSMAWSMTSNGLTLGFYPYESVPKPVEELSWIQAVVDTRTALAHGPPLLYENLARMPEAMHPLLHVKQVLFSCGLIAPWAREVLHKHHIHPTSIFGATEVATLTSIGEPVPDDIYAVRPNSAVLKRGVGAFFRPLPPEESGGNPQIVEMLFYPLGAYFEPILYNDTYRGKKVYATGDKFYIDGVDLAKAEIESTEDVPFDTRICFSILGRRDELLVLSNGEKANPAPIAVALKSLPDVQEVIVFGTSRTHLGALIQLRPTSPLAREVWDEDSISQARKAFTPTLETINRSVPSFARLSPDMLLFTAPDRPFVLTAKSSVRTAVSLELYTNEIEAAYRTFDRTGGTGAPPPPVEWTLEATTNYVRALLLHVLAAGEDSPVPLQGDFFQTLGLDSLGASTLRSILASVLPAKAEAGAEGTYPLSPRLVYDHPTVSSFAHAIVAHVKGHANVVDDLATMRDMVTKYSIPSSALATKTPSCRSRDKFTFLVTGTTGSLGTNLLADLVEREGVEHIYALNRPSNSAALERQIHALKKQGLPSSIAHSPKITYLTADWSSEEALRASLDPLLGRLETAGVTHLVHLAWQLDFNLSVCSFESQIAGVQTLLRLAARWGAKMVYLSSVARVAHEREKGEDDLPLSAAVGGYGQSKAVAEKLILSSFSSQKLNALIVRSGQLSGSTRNGAWNPIEWVPALLTSSTHTPLGALPGLQGQADWLPVDLASKALLEIALAPQGHGVVHLSNPEHTTYHALFSAARLSLGVDLISPQEWLERLTRLDGSPTGDRLPALRLLSFFQQVAEGGETSPLTPLPVGKALALSPTLGAVRAVQPDDFLKSVAWWREQGVLS